jgi:nicotinamidase-related amidase
MSTRRPAGGLRPPRLDGAALAVAPRATRQRPAAVAGRTAGSAGHQTVNSAFHGTPDLDGWLRSCELPGFVVAGITTNHCCETTARVGANLGHRVLFALDATYTFDRPDPDGGMVTADELARVTATNLHGEFATVVRTSELTLTESRRS